MKPYRRKRTDAKTGRVKQDRCYTVPVRVQGEKEWRRIPTDITEPLAAKAFQDQEQKRLNRIALGMEDEVIIPHPSAVVLLDHLPAYVAHVKAEHPGRRAKDAENLITPFLRESGIRTLAQLTAKTFTNWRTAAPQGYKTKNEYLCALRTFVAYLKRQKLAAFDPLDEVEQLKTRGRETFRRPALTVPEISRLLAVAGPRRTLYEVMFFTAMRRGSLFSLTVKQLVDDGQKMGLRIRSDRVKNARDAFKPFPAELAANVRELVKDSKPEDFVFQGRRLPDQTMMLPKKGLDFWKADLKKAGIPFELDGERVDFHAGRHTAITLAALFSRSAPTLQGFSNHASVSQLNRYTDLHNMDQERLVADMAASISWTHPGTQNTATQCHLVAQSDTTGGTQKAAISSVKHEKTRISAGFPSSEGDGTRTRNLRIDSLML